LVVEVRDTNGTPLPGQTVTWVGSTGVFPLSASATTDANGRAATKVIISADVALGRAFVGGTVTATANNASVQFNVTGLPIGVNVFPSLVKPSADDRRITAKTGSVVAEAIRVVLLTGGGAGTTFGQPIPNVGLRATTGNTDPQLGPVASCQGGTVLTGANDGAAVCNLSVSGRAGRALLSVDLGGQFGYELELIVTPGDPTTPKIVSGNNQTGNPGQSLPLALVAQITDAAGTPLPNVAASWSVVTPGSGELTGTISTSDGSGRVSTLLRLGTLGGQHTVRVSVGNLSAFFTFTVNVVIGGITKVSGDNQTGVVAGSPFPAPLVVRVTDAQNRPAANITVTWALTGGSAVLSASTSPTDANGQASLNVTAGLTPGSISISASVPNLAPVVFNLASRAPGPALSSSGFVNYATGENYLTPGALAIIRGAGIATNVTGVLNASLLTGQLPTTLNSVTVLFGPEATAVAAPIYQIGNTGGVEYLLVQVPFEVSVPLTQAIIRVGTGSTTISNIPVRAFGPGVLEQTEATTNRRYALAIRPDGTTVTPANPARRGERIRIYAIGLGQTSPATGTNRLGAPGQTVVAPVVVGVNNAGVPVISATLAQNLVGIYEIVFEIPLDTAVGSFRPLGFFVETGGGTVQYANGSSIHIQ
jgi:uncharacterized protein (TIGR03437 family)